MPTLNVPFAGGQAAVPGWGDRWDIVFGGTWSLGNAWQVLLTSTQGSVSLGVGQLYGSSSAEAVLNASNGTFSFTTCFTFKNRVYVNNLSSFAFSDNSNISTSPLHWDVQDPGAGRDLYLSQYGQQDVATAFGQLQGRLAVFGRRSIQLWSTDADPSNFSLVQTLDNIGTQYPLSVTQLGDYDVLFLDDTGVRSLRAREVTLNAYIDDVGSPIDETLQLALLGYSGPVCGAVEPKTKNFWLYVNGAIYVLSRHLGAKISAWSTFEPRGNDNVLFTPQKFVVLNGTVYTRASQGGHYVYGGSSNQTYDQFAVVTVKTPYLDDKRPRTDKVFNALSTVQEGNWTHAFATDPKSDTYVNFPAFGSTTNPSEKNDSTYDFGVLRAPAMRGTHVSVRSVSNNLSTTQPAILGQLLIHYNAADEP